jgi:hypothetical protein
VGAAGSTSSEATTALLGALLDAAQAFKDALVAAPSAAGKGLRDSVASGFEHHARELAKAATAIVHNVRSL